MKFLKTKINGVVIVENIPHGDDRGYFMEVYHSEKFKENGINQLFIQDNYAKSELGILRGLHYQYKFPQGKLIRCIKGKILDVAVDLRLKSPTFGQHVAEILSSSNYRQLYVPPGFAHGYSVLTETAEVSYKCTDIYHPEDEYGILWNDSELNIDWKVNSPALSDKDKKWPKLGEIKSFFDID